MSNRAAIVLVQDDRIALIERHRNGMHYFTFPGGHVEPGEKPEQAAVRETKEELGLDVVVQRLAVKIWWRNAPQYYYLVSIVGGEFGTGTGEEFQNPGPGAGSYLPLWVPIADLPHLPLLPERMAKLVVQAQSTGWPEPAPVFHDQE